MNGLLALCFFVSGFCGLLYQTVWMRLAFADFGVISPVVSLVVSVFMLGLAGGSWFGGRLVNVISKGRVPALACYGLVELIISSGAFIVPAVFHFGSAMLMNSGQSDSLSFLGGSAFWIAIAMLPFATAMGCTYPFALRAYQQARAGDAFRFGFLYAFNTLGALLGCLCTVFVFIELMGFSKCLLLGAGLNAAIGALSLAFAARSMKTSAAMTRNDVALDAQTEAATPSGDRITRWGYAVLFTTGFCSMAMEVAWVRSFTPVLWQTVYTFGFLLASYLVGHAIGSFEHYRTARSQNGVSTTLLVVMAAFTACLPLTTSDTPSAIALCIASFAAILGWLTPKLVDSLSASDPHVAGRAYAVNSCGCIMGPLISGYILVPALGAQRALIVLALPLLFLAICVCRGSRLHMGLVAATVAVMLLGSTSGGFEEPKPARDVLARTIYRDYAATSVAERTKSMEQLVVNGQTMTTSSPVTKLMADLALVTHRPPAKDVLVICMGMGTTYRTALSWGTNVTVVELIPGVVKAFDFFHPEQATGGASGGRVIVDDGRRFLSRTNQKFDVVIIDPPPPVWQTASSLLYSSDFYAVIKQHLKPGGILQQWYGFPKDEQSIKRAVAESIKKSFPYVRAFHSCDDPYGKISGWHFLCAMQPIPEVSLAEFIERMPAAAKDNLTEDIKTPDRQGRMVEMISQLLSRQVPLSDFAQRQSREYITDDHPYNEYFLVRFLERWVDACSHPHMPR